MDERAIGLLTTGIGITLGIVFTTVTGLLGEAVNALRDLYAR